MKDEQIREAVRSRYGDIAQGKEKSCCGGGDSCSTSDFTLAVTNSTDLGYSSDDLSALPEGADLGLGCGNPQAIAALKPGEIVLDLGSGAGIDCFLASKKVGSSGRAIGVDMTANMIGKARRNAEKGKFSNVEFRLGEIEHLPVADNSVDVIISNCVVNLSPDKPQVFRDMHRVLKSGGRVAISDVVATAVLPEEAKKDLALFTGCMAGAWPISDLEKSLRTAGFEQIHIEPKDSSKKFIRDWAPGRKVEEYITSANITARKP